MWTHIVWTSCSLWLQLIWAAYLLMYSPVSTLLQALHLKQPRCHCLSNARRACPFLMSRPHPAQSVKSKSAMALKVSKQRGNTCRVNKCFFSLFPVKTLPILTVVRSVRHAQLPPRTLGGDRGSPTVFWQLPPSIIHLSYPVSKGSIHIQVGSWGSRSIRGWFLKEQSSCHLFF